MAPGDNPRLKEKKDDEGTRHVKLPLPSAPVPESCSKRGEGLLSVVYLVVEGLGLCPSPMLWVSEAV
ncbi:hypothetical protein PVK06_028706 [Gossypium arboreum]|uniref:Uncharacterized protein n=1 Tax=Gossypium arboreum TaxID=29729 RepID=A0ABR0P4M2_GOSAR|nr:hypothetical protein PVK06_028706 [Gossypium arboreum]